MTCEKLRVKLGELRKHEADLEEKISETQSYMWSISDYANLDDKYDAAAKRCRELEEELKKTQAKRRKIAKAMEEQGC